MNKHKPVACYEGDSDDGWWECSHPDCYDREFSNDRKFAEHIPDIEERAEFFAERERVDAYEPA